jgi:uncharacterized membrane protein
MSGPFKLIRNYLLFTLLSGFTFIVFLAGALGAAFGAVSAAITFADF